MRYISRRSSGASRPKGECWRVGGTVDAMLQMELPAKCECQEVRRGFAPEEIGWLNALAGRAGGSEEGAMVPVFT